MLDRQIDSFADFHQLVSEYEPGTGLGWCYRGQANFEWELIPKAGRADYFVPIRDSFAHDLGSFCQWRERAVAFVDALPEADLECLAVAQHHGLATRLLDWSLNPLVALYFAAKDETDRDGAVFAFLPGMVAQPQLRIEEITSVAVYFPRPVTRRILAQRGVFTIHPQPNVPLAATTLSGLVRQLLAVEENLLRIRIPFQLKTSLMKKLDNYGINEVTLFPDLDGLSEHVNWSSRAFAELIPRTTHVDRMTD